ncbi:pentatricopeptide repeat-containing protein At5g66520-like isoform X2 [Tasmannia lanceolata]|uniref:pentatricopeptide repeat-containing protein At5g66520-like isoform X2 n=1 Tax=Tasmannia lanceolata TaxID=3420 RepID=UPI004062F42D
MACLAPPSISLQPHNFNSNAPQKSTEEWLFSSLKSAQTPNQLKTLHAQIIKSGLTRNDLVLGQLILCCSFSNSMDYARQVFDKIPRPKLFFYNAMIKGYSETGAHSVALHLYSLMRVQSIPCDSFTFPPVLRSSSTLKRIDIGQELHGLVSKKGFGSKVIVQTALIDMYCACGFPNYARQLFNRVPERDVICWNTMIAGYVKCGEFGSARELFDRMPMRNVSTWNTLMDMYCKCGDVETAHRLFNEMPERDIISWNAIISGYAKGGQCVDARRLFDEMPKRNVVSWNVVITCYMHNRCFVEALELFRMMQVSDIRPNEVTVVAVLPACAHLGALDMGQWIHAYIGRNRIKMDVYVNTALINMYGKCGSVKEAKRVFDNAIVKDCFLCGTMIEVLAMNGKADEAFEIFEYMKSKGIKPNDVTFVGLLKACSHTGLVDIGVRYFDMMRKEFGLMPKVEHFGCMVDILGRAGFLDEAHELIKSMPMEPHPVVWGALLSSCRIHGNVKLAEEVALHLLELEPESCGNYVLLSNIYSKAGRWDDAVKIRKLMKEKGVQKKPGCSSIEVNNGVYEFFAGDRAHTQCIEIYEMLDQMVRSLKEEGYVPHTSSVLHDVESDGKEQALIHHSEKLAVAFGLLSTERGSVIRIVKNLRVCDDCHLFMKLVSKYYGRQMIVRDCNRFHHFRDGYCSCSDYW